MTGLPLSPRCTTPWAVPPELPGNRLVSSSTQRSTKRVLVLSLLMLAMPACKREADVPVATEPAAEAPATAPSAPVDPKAAPELKDVIETSDRYIVGISYSPRINQYPGLARVVHAHAAAARAALAEAVAAFGNDKPSAPYELSLAYEMLLETPRLVAVAADGSRYTGGAHGEPLVERLVWLPQRQELLTTEALVPTARGWAAIGMHVREQLHTSVSVRAEADDLSPEQRLRLVREADKAIDEGTGPEVGNFSRFLPLVDANGRITALRFVFPPYQVGPYADGTQSVDVPAAVLLPHVAPQYAELFGVP